MSEKYVFEKRWFMLDFARQRTFDRNEIILLVDKLSELGYNGLGVYIEGAFDFDCFDGVVREGVITKDDAAYLMAEAEKRNMIVFPMTNVVGHMEHFFRQERFADLSDANAPLYQLNFLDERAEEFAMQIVHEFTSAFPCGMINIGGDETHLTDDNKVLYAKFLAKICKNLLDEGIQPSIWGDMIWMDGELTQYFDRRVSIFDWNYYGHRPESIAFFKECGFEDVVPCPSDNSWSGFINYQHPDGWNRARADIPVKPYEVEMFLEDGREQGVMNGLLTCWNIETGRNLWAQWSAFTRAGLYMSGKLRAGEEHDDEKIEMALFGRVTPYTKITRALQDEIQNQRFVWYRELRPLIFSGATWKTFYEHMRSVNADFFLEYPAVIARLHKELDTWDVQGEFETKCYAAMRAVLAIINASVSVATALHGYYDYARAAKLQFEKPSVFSQIMHEIAGKFRKAKEELNIAIEVHGVSIKDSGHSKADLVRMRMTCDAIERVAELIEKCEQDGDRIPLPRFDYLFESAIARSYVTLTPEE